MSLRGSFLRDVCLLDITGKEIAKMSENGNFIGRNIRSIRLKESMTQQQLADACSLSKGMISKLENGAVVPALATLQKIATALHVKAADLIESSNQSPSVMTVNPFADMNRFIKTQMGYWMFNPAVGLADIVTQPILIIAREEEVKPHLVCHPGEEYIFIFDGEMNFAVDGVLHLLRRGDSLFFDGTKPHGIASVNGLVQYVDVLVGHSMEDSKPIPQSHLMHAESMRT